MACQDVAIPVTEEVHARRSCIEQPDDIVEDSWKLCWKEMQAEDTKLFEDWKGQTRDLMLVATLVSCAMTIFASQVMTHPNHRQAINTGFPYESSLDDSLTFLRLSGLALGYATVIACISAQSYLRGYPEPHAFTARELVQLRQAWHARLNILHVPLIMRLLPFMLQVALTLFIVGLAGHWFAIVFFIRAEHSTSLKAFSVGAGWGTMLNVCLIMWLVPKPAPRTVHFQPIWPNDSVDSIFHWLHTQRPHCADTDGIIASCAWTEELPALLRLVGKYGEDYPWAYGNAIISAIHFERDCQCGQAAASPSCSNVHLPELVEALCGLPSWSEELRTDPRRRDGWNLAVTWACGAMMRILLDERTRDAAIVHTDRFKQFLAQQTEIVEELRVDDKWGKYYCWPSRLQDLAVVQPSRFEGSLGITLRDLQLPKTHDDEDVEVHRLLVAAGNAVCAHHAAQAAQGSALLENDLIDVL